MQCRSCHGAVESYLLLLVFLILAIIITLVLATIIKKGEDLPYSAEALKNECRMKQDETNCEYWKSLFFGKNEEVYPSICVPWVKKSLKGYDKDAIIREIASCVMECMEIIRCGDQVCCIFTNVDTSVITSPTFECELAKYLNDTYELCGKRIGAFYNAGDNDCGICDSFNCSKCGSNSIDVNITHASSTIYVWFEGVIRKGDRKIESKVIKITDTTNDIDFKDRMDFLK